MATRRPLSATKKAELLTAVETKQLRALSPELRVALSKTLRALYRARAPRRSRSRVA